MFYLSYYIKWRPTFLELATTLKYLGVKWLPKKKKLILCPERVFLGLHAVKCNITKLTIKNKEKLAFIGQSAVLGC